MSKPPRVGIIGCGAVVENYYAPALRALERSGDLQVAGLVDPVEARTARIAGFFPGARRCVKLPAREEIELAIVATPVRFHHETAVELLARGTAVLCEKPIAANCAEAESMVAAAREGGAVFAVGMFRRFFPALQMIQQFQAGQTFGRLRRLEIQEGGPFNWPAATPSFFDPKQAGGGVLLDVGVHVLDVLDWWLGEPRSVAYTDDAAGGLEANCRIQLHYGAGGDAIEGRVLLSRDWKTSNTWRLEFERATVVWRVGQADRLEICPQGSALWLAGQLEVDGSAGRAPADTYLQAFTRQLADVLECLKQGRKPRVGGEEALRSLRLIERCYRTRGGLKEAGT